MTTQVFLDYGEILKISQGNQKMGGIWNLSTSCLENTFCQMMHSLEGTPCFHCYGMKNLKMYKGNRDMVANNYRILTSRILSEEETRAIAKACASQKYLRLEAFGEIEQSSKGMTQFTNYYNIAKAMRKYDVVVVLWTKNIRILKEFFKDHKMLDNFRIILSSHMVNQKIDVSHLPTYLQTCRTFTVVDSTSELAKQRNCFGGTGENTCSTCNNGNPLCYSFMSRVQEIIEQLRK